MKHDRRRRTALAALPVAALLATLATLAAGPPVHAATTPAATADIAETVKNAGPLAIPDVPLVDQDGRPVHLYSDLIRGKTVAMSFIFTSCTTICPPIGANFGKLRTLLDERRGAPVELLSVSVDPETDTPAKLKAWSAKFHRGPGWTLLTGKKEDVDRLLKALHVFTADRSNHTPTVLLGSDPAGRFTHAYGLAQPAKLVEILDALAQPTAAAATPPAPAEAPDSARAARQASARHYFGDVPLIDQDGRTHRLYSDLLADHTVVIDAFFASCTGSCPVMGATLARLQGEIGDRLGKDVYLLSISVDPETDTPAKLKEYAARLGAKPGWLFLTGSKENVDLALGKLGQRVQKREDHSNVLLVGNDKTGLWKKVFGLADPQDVAAAVKSVLDDRGEPEAQAKGGR
ncbi:MAG TPA: SCO family protein [Thermoanaerobaculia bacterium]